MVCEQICFDTSITNDYVQSLQRGIENNVGDTRIQNIAALYLAFLFDLKGCGWKFPSKQLMWKTDQFVICSDLHRYKDEFLAV